MKFSFRKVNWWVLRRENGTGWVPDERAVKEWVGIKAVQ